MVGLGQLGELERAAALYPSLIWALELGIMMDAVRGRLVHTAAGISAAAAGGWDDADEHFAVASEHADRLGLRCEQAELLRFRALARLWRGGPGDIDAAAGMLTEAQQRYESLGMPRHIEVCREMMVEARI